MGVFLISCVSTSLKLLTWSLYFTVSCILIRSGTILASVADTPARKLHHMAWGARWHAKAAPLTSSVPDSQVKLTSSLSDKNLDETEETMMKSLICASISS